MHQRYSKYLILALCLALGFLVLPNPGQADEPTCYACGEGASCATSSLANFAQKGCERRCFFFNGSQFCLCRTYGSYCITGPEGLEAATAPDLTPVFSLHRSLYRKINDVVGEDVGTLFDQVVMDHHLGTTRGNAVADVTPDGPGGMMEMFSFVAKTRLTAAGLSQHIQLEGHPEIEAIEATFVDDGRRAVLVLTPRHGRLQHVELSAAP